MKLVRELSLAIVGAGMVLLVLEATLRLADDFGRNGPSQIRTQVTDGVQMYRGRPWLAREFVTPIHYNVDGYHAADFTATDDRPWRVAVLGDSYVKAMQLPREENLVAVAEQLSPGVQFLGLGGSARFFPNQVEMLHDEFDQLFGANGKYAPVDAIVFCLRAHSMRHVAEASVAYAGYPAPERPWTYRLKSRGHEERRAPFRRALRSPSHALSLLGHRVQAWQDADLRRNLAPPTADRVDYAHHLMVTRSLEPALAWAEERGLAVGFLYLPSVSEASGAASAVEQEIHHRWLRTLESRGLAHRDASEGLTEASSRFFPSDRHPNSAGHRAFGTTLAELAEELLSRD